MAVFRGREGVVRGGVALGFFVKVEHRKVHHPHRAPAFLKQVVLFAKLAVANLDTQGTDGVIDDFLLVGTEENQVAILCTSAFQNGRERLVMDVFDDGALQTLAATGQLIDLDVGQPLGTVDLDELGVGINLAAAQTAGFPCATGDAKRNHAATLHGGGTREDFEVHVFHDVCDFREFKLDAQIGLV